jgi:N-acetylglucosamine-6-phosphate deacetylase
MKQETIIAGARVFDGEFWFENAVLSVNDGQIAGLEAARELPSGDNVIDAQGQLIVPGFIDLQVNGGGGVLLNDERSVEGIAAICSAHAKFGTTALLPTLITDRPQIVSEVIAAGIAAREQKIAGFLGLHLEGPHLSIAKKGAHDPNLIRAMAPTDVVELIEAKTKLDVLLATVAPENVSQMQVSELAASGVTISLGHTEATFATANDYQAAGARMATHLFNAMLPFGHREPGLGGAALTNSALYCGLIADGVHVHPAAMDIAIKAKAHPGRICLVTDAMSPMGTDMRSFTLNGREILRSEGRLTLADGTLAGADIDMVSCVLYVHQKLGVPLEEALRMASLYPAQAVKMDATKGRLRKGFDADFVMLTQSLDITSTWIAGNQTFLTQ